jgi:carbon-monoxide dehydrogenase iron sulfur subunit
LEQCVACPQAPIGQKKGLIQAPTNTDPSIPSHFGSAPAILDIDPARTRHRNEEDYAMKQVVVHPEKCVGCMQCTVACAVAHSSSRTLYAALLEEPLPRPRIHIGSTRFGRGFPNRCRHCDPAPCMRACLPGAIYRVSEYGTVLIDPDKCINCASCAMACPFGVIRYHEDAWAQPGKTVAIKCDNCLSRQLRGLIPACVEACKSGALCFEEMDHAQRRKTDVVSDTVWSTSGVVLPAAGSIGFDLLHAQKKAMVEMAQTSRA